MLVFKEPSASTSLLFSQTESPPSPLMSYLTLSRLLKRSRPPASSFHYRRKHWGFKWRNDIGERLFNETTTDSVVHGEATGDRITSAQARSNSRQAQARVSAWVSVLFWSRKKNITKHTVSFICTLNLSIHVYYHDWLLLLVLLIIFSEVCYEVVGSLSKIIPLYKYLIFLYILIRSVNECN